MDYDNFRQMVLGANLNSMSTREIQSFKPSQRVNEQNLALVPNSRNSEPDSHCEIDLSFRNFSEFKKIMQRIDQQTAEQREVSVKEVVAALGSEVNVNAFISYDFDCSWVMKLFRHLASSFDQELAQSIFIALTKMSEAQNFNKMFVKFLSAKDRVELSGLLDRINQQLPSEFDHLQIQTIKDQILAPK